MIVLRRCLVLVSIKHGLAVLSLLMIIVLIMYYNIHMENAGLESDNEGYNNDYEVKTEASEKLILSIGFDKVLIPRILQPSLNEKYQKHVEPNNAAILNYDINPLLDSLGDEWQWKFIKKRIQGNWPILIQGANYLLDKEMIPNQSTRRKVVVFPGLLMASDYAKKASFGGPLGELVQWSDLIAGLYILGHEIELQYETKNVDMGLQLQISKQPSSVREGCKNKDVDYIYTDLLGHESLSKDVQEAYRKKFRILDHFGTEQMYNNKKYAKTHGHDKHCGKWGLRNLHLKQFYTGFPQTMDNSFLGFIIGSEIETKNISNLMKKNIAYIYGKDPNYVVNRTELPTILPLLKKYFEVHTTLPYIPETLKSFNLINHGLLDRDKYMELLNEIKIVVGIGVPEEGPGVIEALSKGAIFFNPVRAKHWKYNGKPTNRTLTSQNPYAEKFIGPPYVYTIDYSHAKQVEAALKLALNDQLQSFIPFELTTAGYLQRLNSLLNYQDFCDDNLLMWPPIASMIIYMGDNSRSCNEVCESQGVLCENMYFSEINSMTFFQSQNLSCNTVVYEEDIYAPAYISSQSKCILQKDPELFSCASYLENTLDIKRICPCRDFIKHQVQLCEKC